MSSQPHISSAPLRGDQVGVLAQQRSAVRGEPGAAGLEHRQRRRATHDVHHGSRDARPGLCRSRRQRRSPSPEEPTPGLINR